MRRLVLPREGKAGDRFLLDPETSRYLLKVLRLPRGHSFEATDAAGQSFNCELVGVSRSGAAEILLSPWTDAREEDGAETNLPKIALIQALPKGTKFDLILRQAVEAGVGAVFPLQTRNCVARELGEAERADKRVRREKIVREALQQSGSSVWTKVLPTTDLAGLPSLLDREGFGKEATLYLICHELPLPGKSLHEYCAGADRQVAILVGPEGGFDSTETQAFLGMGFLPYHFPGTILRTETAALYAVAAVKTIIAEKKTWKTSI